MRVLCVCLGNICRSPMAEAVLRSMAGDRLEVDSAGTGDWHIGKSPYAPAIRAAEMRGYDLTSLRARQLSVRDFEEFDLILTMDAQNFADVEGLRPPGNATPVRLFLQYAPKASETEVPDPYFTGNFELALDLVEQASRGLLATLD